MSRGKERWVGIWRSLGEEGRIMRDVSDVGILNQESGNSNTNVIELPCRLNALLSRKCAVWKVREELKEYCGFARAKGPSRKQGLRWEMRGPGLCE